MRHHSGGVQLPQMSVLWRAISDRHICTVLCRQLHDGLGTKFSWGPTSPGETGGMAIAFLCHSFLAVSSM